MGLVGGLFYKLKNMTESMLFIVPGKTYLKKVNKISWRLGKNKVTTTAFNVKTSADGTTMAPPRRIQGPARVPGAAIIAYQVQQQAICNMWTIPNHNHTS